MNKTVTLSLLLLLTGLVYEGNCAYNLDFASYIGGAKSWDMIRDICVDNQGYIYIVGGTQSSDFPTTPGAYDRTFATGGADIGSGGVCDVFVTKIDPNSGQIVWSTFLGGPNYDRAYAVEVDRAGYVYVAGRAGPGFPTTPNAFQPAFAGCRVGSKGLYGYQNAFVAKLKPDGSDLVWASYVGIGEACRDLAIDDNNDVYVPLVYRPVSGWTPQDPAWFSSALQNAYQKTRRGGEECGAVKISSDGTQVIWATWLGGSGDDCGAASIRVDNSNNVYLSLSTNSSALPDVSGTGYYNDGKVDFYVAKFSPDGSNLDYGTYLGGAGDQWMNTHNLAVDNNGNAYVSVNTPAGYPITNGAFQETYGGGGTDMAITKLNSRGGLVASTFIGGSGGENPDGIYVDDSGNVFITGRTDSTNFPVSSNPYQANNSGKGDAVILILSSDFSQLLYSTYIGGSADDNGRTGYLGSDGRLYLGGTSDGPGWPAVNAFQSFFAGGSQDGIVAKFTLEGATLPVANAGPDQNVTDSDRNGSEQVTLDGSASSDPDGTIVSFVWTKGATQIATGAKPTVTLSTGTHIITLTVTDNGGLTDTDTVTITVSSPANQPPLANAGPDQTVIDNDRNGSEQVTLDGSASSDPDGTIVSFVWTKGATQIATGAKPIVTLSTGTHLITLTVTDNGGLTDTDTVNIKVLKGRKKIGELPRGCYNNVINPLKGEEAIIMIEIEEQARVKIILCDTEGNKIRELANEEKEPGPPHKYYWDGKDDSGNVVGSGLYFAHIQAGDYKKTEKIVVVK